MLVSLSLLIVGGLISLAIVELAHRAII